MGLFQSLKNLLTGKGREPLYPLDEQPQPAPAAKPAATLLPPGAQVTHKVTVNGKEVTDPAEIARIEKDFAAGLARFGQSLEHRHGASVHVEIKTEYKGSDPAAAAAVRDLAAKALHPGKDGAGAEPSVDEILANIKHIIEDGK